jgi:hypothetical protein
MTCVCGHSDDLHETIVSDDDTSMGVVIGSCNVCECKEFTEDIDEDELEVE